jgi:hypothetical protein
MATTPEGKVKLLVKTYLKLCRAYWHMPVQNGMGQPALDFHVCLPILITPDMVGKRVGLYVGIETKAPGKPMTPRQALTAASVVAAGGKVFLIDGDTQQLKEWYEQPAW